MKPTSILSSLPLSLLLLTATTAAQDGALDLRVTAKKGSSVWLTQENAQEQIMDMGGQEIEVSHTTVHTLHLTVKDVDEKNGLVVEMNIARIHGSISSPMGGDMEFDSAAPAGEGGDEEGMGMPSPAMIGKALTALAGKSFTAKVDSFGKVTSMEGAAEVLAEAKKVGRGMGGNVSEQTLKNFVEGAFGEFPDKPVAIGATWNREKPTTSDAPGTKLQLTLAKADADAFEVTATGTLENPADAKPAEGGHGERRSMQEMMKIKNSKISGAQRVSRQDGFVLEARTEVSMDADMEGPMGEMSATIKSIKTTKRTTAEAAMPKKAEPAKDAPKDAPKENGK
jgi:hypothetical protein